MKNAVLLAITVCLLIGCGDKYQEAFDAGYSQGEANAETRLRFEYEQKLLAMQRQQASGSKEASPTTSAGNGIALKCKQ